MTYEEVKKIMEDRNYIWREDSEFFKFEPHVMISKNETNTVITLQSFTATSPEFIEVLKALIELAQTTLDKRGAVKRYKVKSLLPGMGNKEAFLNRYTGEYTDNNKDIAWSTTDQTRTYQTKFTLSELDEILGEAWHHNDVFELIEVKSC
jgi:hypothetical protein